MKKNTKKGFTLVELLVVIAILAILASVAVVGYTAFIDKAKKSNAETEAHQIATAIEATLVAQQDYVLGTVTNDDDSVTTYYAQKTSTGEITLNTKSGSTYTPVTTLPDGFVWNTDMAGLPGTWSLTTTTGYVQYTQTAYGVAIVLDLVD